MLACAAVKEVSDAAATERAIVVKRFTSVLLKLHGQRWLKTMAETKRFELLKGFTPYLVSSEAHSTGLCDVSELHAQFTGFGTVYYPPFRRENDLGRLDS